MSDKQAVRKRVKAATLELIASGGAALQETSIWAQVEAFPGFAEASALLLYSSLPDEVSTTAFIRKWQSIKRIVLPVVDGDKLRLRRMEYMVPGYRGIWEPGPQAEAFAPESIDFAIIPGVAFEAMAMGGAARLGRGKGYYDCLLPQLHCPTVGVGYSTQQVEGLPTDPWDIPLTAAVFGK